MKSRSKRKLINEYKFRLHREFDPWIEEINEMLRAGVERYKINNKLVDIRNKSCDFLDLCLFEMASLFEHEKAIRGSLKLNFEPPLKSYGKQKKMNAGKKHSLTFKKTNQLTLTL